MGEYGFDSWAVIGRVSTSGVCGSAIAWPVSAPPSPVAGGGRGEGPLSQPWAMAWGAGGASPFRLDRGAGEAALPLWPVYLPLHLAPCPWPLAAPEARRPSPSSAHALGFADCP